MIYAMRMCAWAYLFLVLVKGGRNTEAGYQWFGHDFVWNPEFEIINQHIYFYQDSIFPDFLIKFFILEV